MTSLRELAEALELSITQVSRALDDKPDVAAKTKTRVREMAGKMGYFPNAAARSLRKQKADMVAAVLPSGASHIGLGALLDMLYAAANHLTTYGYDMVLVPGLGSELEQLRRIVDGRKADAIILVRTRRDDERVAFLTARGIPFITHGRTAQAIDHAYIDGDGEAGFADATRFLATLGHRRIAHVGGPRDYMFAHLRRSGWIKGMHEIDAAAGLLEAEAFPSEQGGYEAASLLLKHPTPPTALLCATDAMAIGAYSAAREHGMTPGRDISIVGHDNLKAGRLMTPHLTTMEIAAVDVGQQLAEMLHKRLTGTPHRDLQCVLPIQQVPRGSHGPPRPARASAR